MRPQVQLTQESLFGFLSGTGLPLVTSLVSLVRWIALGMAIASLGYGMFALVNWEDGFWSPVRPWAGALPALASCPLHLMAWRFAGRRRMQDAALSLFAALFLLSILATWPRGAFCPAWYVHPFLALLATSCLGVVPGLSLTLLAVVVMLVAPFAGGTTDWSSGLQPEIWTHTTSLAAVTLASALTGALMHKVLIAALVAVEAQRRKNLDSSRALRYREKLLRHAMRVETVGDLAGLVTHQLRNAFQVMLGHVTLGSMGGGEDPAQRLALIGETLNRSRPLLDQLMTLAHPDEGSPEHCDLNELIGGFFDRAQRVMFANITLGFERTSDALPVLLDSRGLEHAMWNLVINAHHAMPDGGTITFRTGCEDGLAWVAVTDTGCGIPLQIQNQIFDPYFTTKPPGQGTGLGLAAVARFVRGSNGSIHLESELGKGTTFWLRFPLAKGTITLRSA